MTGVGEGIRALDPNPGKVRLSLVDAALSDIIRTRDGRLWRMCVGGG